MMNDCFDEMIDWFDNMNDWFDKINDCLDKRLPTMELCPRIPRQKVTKNMVTTVLHLVSASRPVNDLHLVCNLYSVVSTITAEIHRSSH